MLKKQLYEAPEAELLVVRFEGGFLTNSPTGESFEGNTMTGLFDEDED